MSSVLIRRARAEDGPAIAAVQKAAWLATYRHWIPEIVDDFDEARTAANWSRAAADKAQYVTVATVDGGVVAYALLGPPEPDSVDGPHEIDRTGEIHALYAHPDVHGHGVGRLLVDDALRLLARKRREHCVVWAIERNTRSRGFYEHLGFSPCPTRETRVWRGLQSIRYRRATAGC